ncbi:MAG TPA: hypothetical protein DD477_01200 [Spirochaetaceae bacterium]|nr:hypothetical protein [Spirochaetaceae bacterium]HAW84728.1 hypothetical protein [Spirochaetaceae bacterium]HAX36432.1 hypothetical protein [Spirochaetaceae bacterium]HBO39822.1 hypothetical protein [Spirochaetaceae bacterium]HCQ85926.1 hypothetical protein [Spirochaetaceae bacterium]
MNLEINPRGNGACPMCLHNRNCHVQKQLVSNIVELKAASAQELEIVIYSCPYFQEALAL